TLRAAVDQVDNGYGDSQGNLDLREAIVDREYEKHGVRITSDDVYVTSGVSECINMLMGTFLEPGDEVLVPGPGYPSDAQYINFYEGSVIPYRMIEEEDWRPDVDMIRKRITDKTKALVVINPNNPTGAEYEEKDLREIGDIAAEYGIPLISDEIYDKIVFDGEFYSMSKLSSDVPRIILNGFSKVNLMPGWRMGYCYFMDEEGLMDEIRSGFMKQARARICPNVPCQAAARASLQGPQDYIVDMNRKLKERADFTYKRLNEMDLISTRRAKGALYMFPRIDLKGTPWKDDKDFVLDLIKEEGVVLVHGSGFCQSFGQGHFRTILLPPMATLEEAYDKMESFIRRRTN
ncbi:MAG: aminotransferase class I/II-fold pyridoxal phosphate-dependent enzyme, partial [Candidatus Methanomethylophilaceae archaeon]|nr:aminotransferase class I/II-fold pyridoxal phosphate-dependent enzyme [Candidatus Methanomethylophilaceae archaeon]